MPTVYPSAFGPTFQWESSAGAPANGDKVFFYVNGSNTKQNTYTNSTGGVANTNPVILNSLGMPPNEVWWESGQLYKVVWAPSTDTDPPTSPIRTWDNLSGIGDVTLLSASEWTPYGQAATYISATSFSVVGDQTAIFQIGRRLQTNNSGGTVYSTISNSVFGATTVVTVINDSGVIDAGLSAVYYGILSVNNPSVPATYAKLASPVFSGNPTAPTPSSGDNDTSIATTAFVSSAILAASSPPVRQTILSGPVDSNGFSSFGGSTGSATVTAAGTIKGTVAAGGDANYTGSITNPSWTGLSTNGTMYLYLDITSGGTVTTGSTSLAPVYQWGGAYSTTNLQNTFNIQEMTMKVGNGAAANQVYRVFVGEVTVAGAVTTAIVWYALMSRFVGVWSTPLPGVAAIVSVNHNIGVNPQTKLLTLECTTADAGYAVGDQISSAMFMSDTSAQPRVMNLVATSKTIGFTVGSTAAITLYNKSTGANAALVNASWRYRLESQRGW